MLSGAVSGAGEKHLPQLLQTDSFSLLRANSDSPLKAKAMASAGERGAVLKLFIGCSRSPF